METTKYKKHKIVWSEASDKWVSDTGGLEDVSLKKLKAKIDRYEQKMRGLDLPMNVIYAKYDVPKLAKVTSIETNLYSTFCRMTVGKERLMQHSPDFYPVTEANLAIMEECEIIERAMDSLRKEQQALCKKLKGHFTIKDILDKADLSGAPDNGESVYVACQVCTNRQAYGKMLDGKTLGCKECMDDERRPEHVNDGNATVIGSV